MTLTRWEPLREFSTMQTKTEQKLATPMRNQLRSNRFYRLKRTSHAEINSPRGLQLSRFPSPDLRPPCPLGRCDLATRCR